MDHGNSMCHVYEFHLKRGSIFPMSRKFLLKEL